jgi:hypothetical protein
VNDGCTVGQQFLKRRRQVVHLLQLVLVDPQQFQTRVDAQVEAAEAVVAELQLKQASVYS